MNGLFDEMESQRRSRKGHSTATLVVWVSLAAILTFLLTFFAFRQIYGLSGELRGEMLRFQEARAILSTYYVGQIPDEGALTDAAIAASVWALEDPWSRFLTEEEYAAHLRSLQNRRQGLGLQFLRDEETDEMVVVDTIPGSPANEAGLVGGDTIVTLEGELVVGMPLEDFREVVTANYGGSVLLGVRGPGGDYRDVIVEVRSYYVNPVSYELLEGDVGYIRIVNFQSTSGEEAILAIETLLEEGAEGLIFDLRYNPGGRLDELLLLLDYLLPEGELFVFADYTGQESVRYSGPEYLRVPMVVLVNEWSASAAEFFAAILQEYEWATIVGTPTMGKGRSQVMIPLTGGGAIVLSTSRYLTPGRVDLYEAGGIRPDYHVEAEAGDEDLQLLRALEILGA